MRRGEEVEGRAGSSETSLRSCSPHEGHGSWGWEGRDIAWVRDERWVWGSQTACDPRRVCECRRDSHLAGRARALLAAVVGDALLVESPTATPRGERPSRPEGRLAQQAPRLALRHGSERGVSLLPAPKRLGFFTVASRHPLVAREGFRRKYRPGGRKLRHVARPADARRVASRRDIASRASASPRRIVSRPRLPTR